VGKMLVVYYSYSGNTKMIAETIADTVQGDLHEIRVQGEKKGKKLMGKIFSELGKIAFHKDSDIEPMNLQLEEYDGIFLGSPIWGGNLSIPVRTFLKRYEVRGKKIGFFYSCGGDDPKAREKIMNKVSPLLASDNTLVRYIGFSQTVKKYEQQKSKIVEWGEQVKKEIQEG